MRLTQRFPLLLPLRKWQRKKCYYARMFLDKNRYATRKQRLFPYVLYEDSSLLINRNTGADIQYQSNKVHNLRLAAATCSQIVLFPGEVFSLWWLARKADRREKYKDGLCVHNGNLVAVYGGGLCQLSNQLFWLFLHTPLTILERHTHQVKEFPNPDPKDPLGVDATILEGWLDLKARNDTRQPLQIELGFTEDRFWGRIRTQAPPKFRYAVENDNLQYYHESGVWKECVDVVRVKLDARTGQPISREILYTNLCTLGYTPEALDAAIPSRAES